MNTVFSVRVLLSLLSYEMSGELNSAYNGYNRHFFEEKNCFYYFLSQTSKTVETVIKAHH